MRPLKSTLHSALTWEENTSCLGRCVGVCCTEEGGSSRVPSYQRENSLDRGTVLGQGVGGGRACRLGVELEMGSV